MSLLEVFLIITLVGHLSFQLDILRNIFGKSPHSKIEPFPVSVSIPGNQAVSESALRTLAMTNTV